MNKKSKIIIAILSILVIGLVAYIVVDKVLENNNVKNNETVNTASESNCINNSVVENTVGDNTTNIVTNEVADTNTTNSEEANSSNSDVLSDEEAIKIGNELLQKLNNEIYGKNVEWADTESFEIDGVPYYEVLNIDEIKDVIIEGALEDYFDSVGIIKYSDGKYYSHMSDAGETGDAGIIKIDSKTNDEIQFSCGTTCWDSDYMSVSKMKIKKIDSKWKVCEYYYCN